MVNSWDININFFQVAMKCSDFIAMICNSVNKLQCSLLINNIIWKDLNSGQSSKKDDVF